MKHFLRTLWCDLFHAGGTIKRDQKDCINWQCATCGRWGEPISHEEEELMIQNYLRKTNDHTPTIRPNHFDRRLKCNANDATVK